MKQYLKPKYLPYCTLIACLLGFLLRLWTLSGGPNDRGLYAPHPAAWVLIWILTALLAAAILFTTRQLKNPGKYADNFPPSFAGFLGTFLGAAGILYSALRLLLAHTASFGTVTGLVGIVSAVTLLLTALNRRTGSRSAFGLHVIPCLFFALRIFYDCREWSTQPQISIFIFPFLASICVMLAAYQLAAFDVKLGKRPHLLFWSLMGTYFCCLALPLSSEKPFYLFMAAWLMTNLCSLRSLKRKPEPQAAPKAESAAEIQPEDPA